MLGLREGLIKLVDFSCEWQKEFSREKIFLDKIIGQYVRGIEHIGSTAIRDIKSKPIIDIMIGLKDFKDIGECSVILSNNGYVDKGEYGIKGRIFFIKTSNNITTHHVHAVECGCEFWEKRISFRDLLNADIKLRNEYNDLKKLLKDKYGDNRDSYTGGKTKFIDRVLNDNK